jgi:HEPN domain-containing protein
MSKLDTQIKKVLREMSEEPEYGRLDRSLIQDVIDRILSDETGEYKNALRELNSEYNTEDLKELMNLLNQVLELVKVFINLKPS